MNWRILVPPSSGIWGHAALAAMLVASCGGGGAPQTVASVAGANDRGVRYFELSAVTDGSDAIRLWNPTDEPADFVLTHNGFRTFESIVDMVAYVRDMPEERPAESFEQKLWRFVRDNVYHDPFLDPRPWLMSPLVLVNSVGFGLCSSVAAAYVELARATGREARIWALTGHVVPEVEVAGGWAVFDPDLAVYYKRRDGSIAAIADLEVDPSLVNAPHEPIFQPSQGVGYSDSVAGIYASSADNSIWSSLLPLPAGLPGRVTLPPGSSLTYQGRWTSPPIAYGDDGVAVEVEQFEQAALALAPGWTGALPLPWLVWDLLGEGRVRVGNAEYVIGSEALRQRLQSSAAPIAEITLVATSGPVTIVFLVNPLRYEVRDSNWIELEGDSAWRVQARVEQLPPQFRAGGPFPAAKRKPAP